MEVHNVAQGIRPCGKVHGFRPAGPSVEQLLAHALREVSNGSIRNAMLKVCIYPTKSELLSCVVACSALGIVVETLMVTVVMKDLDPVLCGVLFKGKLGGHCFLR